MTKPTLAILGGTGNEGPGLAMRWVLAGYPIIIGSRQKEKAEATAEELNQLLGIDTIQGLENADAALAADICVLTVVAKAHRAALENLKPALQGKLVVDATARIKFPGAFPPEPPSAARIAQDILGDGATVVAAFQNVPASALRKNLDRPMETDVMVCGDDMDAVEKVIALTEAGGMRAFYAGGLDNAIVVEGMTALLITMNKHYGGHGTMRFIGLDKK
jgi:NADPH-dependent F420 reductase